MVLTNYTMSPHSYLVAQRRSISKPPRVISINEFGSGTEASVVGKGKFLCQTKKSSPSDLTGVPVSDHYR